MDKMRGGGMEGVFLPDKVVMFAVGGGGGNLGYLDQI